MKRLITLTICLLLILFAAALSNAQRPELVVQTGHSGWIHTVAFSPDGQIFASGGSDQTIKLWSVATGAELRTLKGHTYSILSIAFNPGGGLLASGSGDHLIKLWDAKTGELKFTLSGHSGPVASVAFSPDGHTLASGSIDGRIKLWNAASGRELRSLANVIETKRPGELHPPNVNSIAFSPDGKLLVSGGIEHTIKLWDVNTGAVVQDMKDTSYEVNTVAFSRDGQTVLSASDSAITVWDVHNGMALRRLPATAGRIDVIAVSPDGLSLAQANYRGTITLRDLKSGAERTLSGHSADVLAVAFAPDGGTLVSGSSDQTIKLWDLSTGVARRTFDGHSGGMFTDQFSNAARNVLAGSTDRTVKLWDLSSRDAMLRTIAPHTSEFLSLTFSPDGHYFVTSGAYDPVRIWDVSTGSEVRKLPWLSVRSDVPVPKAFSPDGKILAGEDNEQNIELYDVATGLKLRTLESQSSGVNSIAFSPDGKILATGGFKEVKLWDVVSGSELHTLADHANIVHAVAFSPDGKTLATDNLNQLYLWDVATGTKLQTLKGGGGENFIFSPDGKTIFGGAVKFRDKVMTAGVTQWDVSTGAELRTFEGHSSALSNIIFGPDAKTMATSSLDNTVRLWDLNTGKALHTLSGHSGQVLSVAFSADGRLLISSSDDLTIKIWAAASGEELATLIALDDQDWTVITPDGFFDGSPAAWNRLAWRYKENPFDVTPIEAYFTEFYYPGLLADIFAGKRRMAPSDISRKDRRQPQLTITLAGTRPDAPLATRSVMVKIEVKEALVGASYLIQPPTPKRLRSRTRQMRTPRPSVQTGSGAQDVRLFRNGSLVKVWRGDVLKGQSSVTLEATIPIVAGENRLTAYAFNRDNIKSTDVTLVIDGAESLRRQGTAYVLAVGVNTYRNTNYNLKYAVADAEAFSAEIKRQQVALKTYGRVEVIPLYDKEATKANILQALAQLTTKAQPEDAVIVYFSGHGTAAQQRFYLIPHDLGYQGPRTKLSARTLKTILRNSISDRELEAAFEKIDAGQLLMVIDACNSGQALDSEEKRRGPMNSKGLAQLAYEKGMYILTAAQSYQAAWEASRLGHGYLTYALIEEGLKQGKADREPKNNEIVLREWLDYATEQVPRLQEEKMKETPGVKDLQGRELEFVFIEGDETIKDPTKRSVQRPRVFYRRELESSPLIIARPQAVLPKE